MLFAAATNSIGAICDHSTNQASQAIAALTFMEMIMHMNKMVSLGPGWVDGVGERLARAGWVMGP